MPAGVLPSSRRRLYGQGGSLCSDFVLIQNSKPCLMRPRGSRGATAKPYGARPSTCSLNTANSPWGYPYCNYSPSAPKKSARWRTLGVTFKLLEKTARAARRIAGHPNDPPHRQALDKDREHNHEVGEGQHQTVRVVGPRPSPGRSAAGEPGRRLHPAHH